jgi:hypothetical protein
VPLKTIELAFATRVMREGRRTGQLPSGLPFSQRSACRAQDTHALRTHALLPGIRYAPLTRCGLLPPDKLWSPSTDSVQAPREWVATAHPLGNVWSAARLQAKSSMRRSGLRQCIRPVVEAFASGHDVLRALLFLTSVSASSALPNDSLRAGRFDLFSHQFS